MNEVYLSRMVSHRQLDAWLAAFYGIEPGTMRIHASDDEFIESAGAYAVNVVAQHIGGDFPQQLSVYVDRSQTDAELAAFLARKGNLEVVFSDDTLNPFRWMVESGKGGKAFFVDAEAFDEGAFVIDRYDSGQANEEPED